MQLKNKKLLSLLLATTVCCTMVGCSKSNGDISTAPDNSLDLTSYFSTNEFSSVKLNKKSKENYEKIMNFQSILKDEYGNPDKKPDYLENLSISINENLDLEEMKFNIIPVTWFNAFDELKESEHSNYIIEYIKNAVHSNISNLNSFMDKEYTNRIVVDYEMPISGSGAFPYYPVECGFTYLRLDNNDYLEITNSPQNSIYKSIKLLYKVEDGNLIEISDRELVNKIENINNSFYNREKLWMELTIDTKKEGNFENIANTKYGYEKEERKMDDYELAKSGILDYINGVNLSIYPTKELSNLLGREDDILDNKEVQNFIKDIENVIDDNFAFLKYKNILAFYKIKQDGIDTLPKIFIKTDDNGKKSYSRINYFDNTIIEENKTF